MKTDAELLSLNDIIKNAKTTDNHFFPSKHWRLNTVHLTANAYNATYING